MELTIAGQALAFQPFENALTGNLDPARIGVSSRLTQRSSVDIPEPEGPITQMTSPRPTT